MTAHKRHGDSHDRPMGIHEFHCCVFSQLSGIGRNDCEECGERWPCAAAAEGE